MARYRCAACRQVFEQAVSDEEALRQKEAEFPDVPIEQCTLVCDRCYQIMREREARARRVH